MLYSTLVLAASLFAAGIQAKYSPSKDAIEADIIARSIKRSPQYYGGGGGGGGNDNNQGQTQSGQRQVQIVTVSNANGDLKYFPEMVMADPGTIVQFQFYPKNHTITESSFAEPCTPLTANLTDTKPGQRSGFVPVAADAQFRPVYNLLVNDTKPIWIYCGQKPHCAKGMAMVINQNMTDPDKTLAKYKEKAAQLAASSGSSSASVVTPPATSGAASPTTTLNSIGAGGASSTSLTVPVSTFTGLAQRPMANELSGLGALILAGMAAVL